MYTRLSMRIAEQLMDREYRHFLRQLLSRKVLSGATFDITKIVLAGEKLSPKQVQVFTKFVYEKYKQRCKNCGAYIAWEDMADAVCSGYLCWKCI